jgi:hypothetical protein
VDDTVARNGKRWMTPMADLLFVYVDSTNSKSL